MENIKKGKIYKIVDNAYTEMYIGSTTQILSQRMANHRFKFINNKDLNLSINKLFEKYGVENCKIELIEEINFINKEELLKKEGEYIKNNICLNKYIAGRTVEEYEEDNKEKIREYMKEYYKDNKEKFKLRNKELNKKWNPINNRKKII